MAGFEDVIERALAKHENATPELRLQVYASARSALVGMLSKSENLSNEHIEAQQQRLETAIINIESRYEILSSPAEVSPELNVDDQFHEEIPVIEPDQRFDDYPATAQQPIDPELLEPASSRRHPFAIILLVTIILAAIGAGVWWVYDRQLFMPVAMRDNSVPNPPRVLVSENSPDDAAVAAIDVFKPDDPTGLVAGATITATLDNDAAGDFVRLAGTAGNPEGFAEIIVDPGVMETMAGKKASFNLKVKSGDGEGHQFVITCQFRELGDCGRKRFTASLHSESFVFETTLKEGVASGDEKSGSMRIVIDNSGTGKALDIYSVQMTILP